MTGRGEYPPDWPEIAAQAKDEAGNRCIRCGHPAEPAWKQVGLDLLLERCDAGCRPEYHREGEAESRVRFQSDDPTVAWKEVPQRVLTVHHFDGDKSNSRWWNLGVLCQVCHLAVQGRVRMRQAWMFEHSDWFRPYVAGHLAFTMLGEDLDPGEVEERMDELLALEVTP